jgi:hypothetical protein
MESQNSVLDIGGAGAGTNMASKMATGHLKMPAIFSSRMMWPTVME